MSKKKEWLCLGVGVGGAMLGVYGVMLLNRIIPVSIPLILRMISIIMIYWLIALPSIIVVIISRDGLTDYGFSKNKIHFQILTGIILGLIMSFLLTLIPHLLGFGGFVDNGRRYRYIWQFVYEFCYCIFSIGCVEEFVFRGFAYEKIKKLTQKNILAAIGSSLLFGILHFLGGNIIQMAVTACIGMFFCFCRKKIRNCSILSLMFAHGVYDAMITVWASLFLQT